MQPFAIFSRMNAYKIRDLDSTNGGLSEAVTLLLSNCPDDSGRYARNRLEKELFPIDAGPLYRKFFGAYAVQGSLIGVGGIKAADWASDTHILYLMAVDRTHRGKGVGTALEKARIYWVRDKFSHGRLLVSTKHKKRFERWDFKVVSEVNDKQLMVLEF